MYNQQDKIDKDTLIKDNQFVDDASYFLIDREGYEPDELDTAEKVYDAYMEHFRYQNVNEATAIMDMQYAQNTDAQSKARMARLMDAYDKMDSDFGLNALGDYAAGIFSAPSTYAGIFTGGGAKVGQLAAQQGLKLGIRKALKGNIGQRMLKNAVTMGGAITEKTARGEALRQAAKTGALRAGAVEAGIGIGQVSAQEQARVESGMQEDIRGGAVAVGALAGAVPGSLFGAGSQVGRAIQQNTATRIMDITEKKAGQAIRLANRTTTREVFEDEATSETANAVFEELKSLRSAPLEQTIPGTLRRGEKLQKELAPEDVEINVPVSGGKVKMPLTAGLELQNLQNISAVAAKIMHTVGDLPPEALKEGQKEAFSSRLARALNSKVITEDSLVELTKKHKIEMSDIAALMAAEYSRGGKALNVASQLSKADKAARLKDLDDIQKAISEAVDITTPARESLREVEQQLETNAVKKSINYLGQVNKARIGFMTVQLATTTRNMTNGYMRNYVYAFDNLGAGLYNYTKGNLKRMSNPTDEMAKEEAVRAVNLGKAQLRTAVEAGRMKDLLSITSSETNALVQLMKDPRFGKSEEASRLFMDMADVAEHTNMDSGILKVARKLNYLNTMSDNMFKRAIMSRELDKALRAGGYEEGLNGVLKKGRFNEIDAKLIGRAMEQALDFTYQTGRFKGKEGFFNKSADFFIEASQTQLGSTFVPFPRYLVNQFRFFYEHAPILGMVDIGGILNKSDVSERFGKQIGGLAVLTSLYALRSNHGDDTTGPFEYFNPFGSGIVDAQASLGPFSAYAVAADALYRMNNDVASPPKIRDMVKALGGGQFRPTGLGIVDGLFDTWQKGIDDGEMDLRLAEMGARYLGNYMNTYTVGAGVLKDIVATLDPDFRVLPDNTDVNLFDYMLKQATRSFPQSIDEESSFFGYTGVGPEREAMQSPTRSQPLRSLNPFMRQLTGLTQQEERNMAEREFDRLGLEYYEISPRKIKFDPELTADARGQMGRFVESGIQDYILRDPDYSGFETDIEKKAALKEHIAYLKREARARVLDLDRYPDPEEQRQVARAKYFNIPRTTRNLIGVYYEKETGKSIDDTKDYITALAVAEKYSIN